MKPFDITIEKWRAAENQLTDIGHIQAAMYTVVLLNESRPFGTCILLQHGGKMYFLTAAHVATEIGKKRFEKIGVAIKPDKVLRNIPLYLSIAFQSKLWDPNFNKNDLQGDPFIVKDLAIIEVPLFLESSIKATKGFIRLSDEFVEGLDLHACYVGLGIVEKEGEIQMTSFGLSLYEKHEKDGRDYYIARAMKETFGSKVLKEQTTINFQGYSGGGLFLVKENSVRLVGIAYYQNRTPLSLADGYVEIHFYGPKSLKAFLEVCG